MSSDISGVPFYVQVDQEGIYNFYFNMLRKVNENVVDILEKKHKFGDLVLHNYNYRVSMGAQVNHTLLSGNGPGELGVIAGLNNITGEFEFSWAKNMLGIAAAVNKQLASEVVGLAKFYCPRSDDNNKPAGYVHLADSIYAKELDDGTCMIIADKPYAYYVHEFTWREHKFPTRAKFLTQAIFEVYKYHGLEYKRV